MTAAERIAELAKIGAYSGGIDRRLATAEDRRSRELFAHWARDAGYDLAQDRIGNLFARRPHADSGKPAIMVGSHLDTVPTGGAYDGAYGVVAALNACELLDRAGTQTQHPIEIAVWGGEEGSRFPAGCLGSSVFANLMSLEDALELRDERGVSLGDALDSAGGLLSGVPVRERREVAGFLEVHIEQGPVLESNRRKLAVVTEITGQRRYRATVTGKSGHAGTVPMTRRSDALSAAAEIILAIEAEAKRIEAVVTVGKITVEPGGSNVIPARAIFSIDARSVDAERIDAIETAFKKSAEAAQGQRGVRVDLELQQRKVPTPLDPLLRGVLHDACKSAGHEALDIPSGAAHDAMCLAKITRSAMLFVPSIGGHSHIPEERTADDDLELGVRVLADALVRADKALTVR